MNEDIVKIHFMEDDKEKEEFFKEDIEKFHYRVGCSATDLKDVDKSVFIIYIDYIQSLFGNVYCSTNDPAMRYFILKGYNPETLNEPDLKEQK